MRLFGQVLGPVVLSFDPLSADALSRLLSVSRREKDALRDLHSLLSVPKDGDDPIQALHLSFPQFLLDPERCPVEFLIDHKKTHTNLVERYLESMSKILTKDICDLKMPGALAHEVDWSTINDCIPSHVQYAGRD